MAKDFEPFLVGADEEGLKFLIAHKVEKILDLAACDGGTAQPCLRRGRGLWEHAT